MSRLLSGAIAIVATAAVLLVSRAAGADVAAGSGIYSFSADNAAPRVLLTGSDGFNGYPAVSPDGGRVAFVSNRERWNNASATCDCSDAVYVMQLDGTGVRRVTQAPNSIGVGWRLSNLVWSSDGRTLYFNAFVVSTGPDSRNNHVSVWRVSSAGGAPEPFDESGAAFALSRDGKYVSVVRRYLYSGSGTLLVHPTSANYAGAQLDGASRHNNEVAPAWSPTADVVAFVDAKGRHVVMAYPSGRRRRTIAADNVQAVAWSPDGKQIAYTRGERRGGLWIAPLGGGRPRRVATVPSGASIEWPAENRLLVGAPYSSVFVRPYGDGLRSAGQVAFPQWAPDGKRLAFLSGTGPYRLNADSVLLGSADGLCRGEGVGTWFCGFAWTRDGRHVLAAYHG